MTDTRKPVSRASRGCAARGRLPAKPRLGETGEMIRSNFVHDLKGANAIQAEIVRVTRAAVATSLSSRKTAKKRGGALVREVIVGAVQAAQEVESDVALASRLAAQGLINGFIDVGLDAPDAARIIMRSVIRTAADADVDVGQTTQLSADGILATCAERIDNIEPVRQAVLAGAFEAAENIGAHSISAMRELLTEMVSETRVSSQPLAEQVHDSILE